MLAVLGIDNIVELVGEGLSFMVSYLRYQKVMQNGGFEVV